MSVYHGPVYPNPWSWYRPWQYPQRPWNTQRSRGSTPPSPGSTPRSPGSTPRSPGSTRPAIRDHGRQPYVVNIEQAARQNNTFRTALWTGEHFQVTLMSIGVGEDIGLEVHPATDQFIRVEQGQGLVQMGNSRDELDFERRVSDGWAVMVPAGKWHNVINTGSTPLKVYVIYAPPEHPFGTVHPTKASAEGNR